MMYSTSTVSTTSGSGRAPCVAAAERRVRVVRLLRPRRSAPAFGFSLRGGKEYATGFFISKVEFNSEAHLQGLKVGDQLVSVNGYRVDDAVHAELVHYLSSQSRLKIKVRHVGILPIKDKPHESLSWQFVSERASLASDVSSSPTLCHDTERLTDLRLSILVPPRAKLGCGICKGPDWKPGIFVQFVREGGIAREAGLRPGDQILSCNGQKFANITFNEAISAMKATGRLELLVREGAGTELVSPESSGYNSSASSAAGERSPAPAPAPLVPLAPPAALRRRLASVAEEAADRADRLTMNRLKRRTWDSLDFNWKNGDIHNFDAPSDIEPDYDSPSIPNNPHTYENKNNQRSKGKEFITSPSNRTIINLTEDGATIQCSYDNNQLAKKNAFASNHTNRDNDKKTIVVEVHHSSAPACGKPHCSVAPPPWKDAEDSTSVASSNTLSSAIAEEILKRKMNKKNASADKAIVNPVKKTNISKSIDNDKKKQHDALMDEFKKVHRKMFANQDIASKESGKVIADEDVDSLDRQQTLPLRNIDHTISDAATNNHSQPRREATDNPPPPPPMPVTNGHQNGEVKNKDVEEKSNENSIVKSYNGDLNSKVSNLRKNGTLTRTPTPDYNNKIDNLTKAKINEENVDLESLESFKLKNPANVLPKPPPTYFVRAPNGTATMKKHGRPVSVTIGEYASNGSARREPTKLDFLGADRPDGALATDDGSISNRLQSELVMTLSRSNLRKKTEAHADAGR